MCKLGSRFLLIDLFYFHPYLEDIERSIVYISLFKRETMMKTLPNPNWYKENCK